MKLLIIQEAGRHEKNKNFRESLNLNRSLIKLDQETKIWGIGYPEFTTKFSELEKWCDVIILVENYNFNWIPFSEIRDSKKLKIFWSIDSHCVLNLHQNICKELRINILLNSTKTYLKDFEKISDKSIWFPNSYPDDLIQPLNIQKTIDVGFCGSYRPEIELLNRFNIKKDIFVIGDDMVNAINSYKIHFNKNISIDINYRTFETLGCQTFLLTNKSPDLEELFDIGNEIIVYNDYNDLFEKVNYYLNNEKERNLIEKNGFNKVKKDHTYLTRSNQLINIINDII
jgi:glycosyltransferase involved in cell wall biosynthesis